MRLAIPLALTAWVAVTSGPALAAERTAVSELMTATWCGYCPFSETALHQLEGEYDRNRFLVMAYHVNDEYSNTEANARISYYTISGTPTNAIDGSRLIVGGWEGVYNSYKQQIDTDLQTEAQVVMNITGSLIEDQVEYAVEVTADTPPDFVDPVLFVALAERGRWDDGEEMRPVVRRIVSYDLGGLAAKGDEVVLTGSFTMEADWVSAEMEVLAFVQDRGNNRRVDQGARMFHTDFDSPKTLVTAVEDSVRTIKTYLTNPNSYPIDMRMVMDEMSEEGWMGTFCVLEWGICLPDSADLTMPADSTVTVKLQWLDLGATEKVVNSNFLIRYGENYETTRGLQYTARSGAVDLSIAEFVIDDDTEGGSNGNDDGQLQPGEVIQFTTRAQNTGELLAYEVSSEMTTENEGILPIETVEQYGDIDAGAIVDGSGGRFAIVEDFTPGPITLTLTFTDGEDKIVVEELELQVLPVGINGDQPSLPAPVHTALHQNHPNPFNPRTTISYDVAAGNQVVQLTIYDLSGREVRRLVDETQPLGQQAVVWDGTDAQQRPVPSGVYLYRLNVGDESHTRRMLLVK